MTSAEPVLFLTSRHHNLMNQSASELTEDRVISNIVILCVIKSLDKLRNNLIKDLADAGLDLLFSNHTAEQN